MIRSLTLAAFLAAPAYADMVELSDLAGEYTVTSARPFSHVAAPYDPDAPNPTGQTITFTENGPEFPDTDCENWSFSPVMIFIPPASDPNFADLFVGHNHGMDYMLECEDTGSGMFLTHVDDRVLLLGIDNSAAGAVLEKPLTDEEVTLVQAALVEMGLLDTASGEMDDATHAAMRVHYRALYDDGETGIPLRPAYTAHFLATLGVE